MPDATDAASLQWRGRIWSARSAQDDGRDAAPDRYYATEGSQGLGTGKCQGLFMRGGGGPCGRPYIFIFVDTDQGSQFTRLEFTQVLQDRGVKISMDGKGRYADNIFVERLWRTVKYEEVYLKAYVNAVEARRELGTYFRLYNNLRPHQALGYRTPAEVFHGEQGVGEESKDRRCSPGTGSVPMAGASGLSLNSALILSN